MVWNSTFSNKTETVAFSASTRGEARIKLIVDTAKYLAEGGTVQYLGVASAYNKDGWTQNEAADHKKRSNSGAGKSEGQVRKRKGVGNY